MRWLNIHSAFVNLVSNKCQSQCIAKLKPNASFFGQEYKYYSTSSASTTTTSLDLSVVNRLQKLMSTYEDFVGLTVVKQAQKHVIEAEADFLQVQEERRTKQQNLSQIHKRLKKLNSELEKIPRTDDRYLQLLTEEHSVIKGEQVLSNEVEELENKERQQFMLLSTALRDSHEKESAQAEKTKYWSVAGSVLGACIGILGTTLNNRFRMRELKNLVTSKESSSLLVVDRLDSIESCVDKINKQLSADSDSSNFSFNNNVDTQTEVLAMIDHKLDNLEHKIIKTAVFGFAAVGLAAVISRFL